MSGRCRGPRAQSDIATLLFCPAALCPLRLPRTAANVCLLAISSSCKLEESPEGEAERGTEQKDKAGEKEERERGEAARVMEEQQPSAVMIFIGA